MIYTSHHPVPPLPKTSVFHYLFPERPGDSPIHVHPPSTPAFIDGPTGRVLTRGELEDGALRIATGLRDLGIQGTALLIGPNSLDWVLAAYGLQAAGVTPSEIAYQYDNSGSSILIADPVLLPAIEEARKLFKNPLKQVLVLRRAPGYKSIHDIKGPRGKAERIDDVHQTAWLCYSSGTTGLPKGVMTSHYNMTCELQAVTVAYPKLTEKDRILGVLPLSHMYGLALLLQQPLIIGVPVVLYPKFEERPVLAGIERYRVSYAMFVPPIVLVLYHSAIAKEYDLTSLTRVNCGAAPMSDELCYAFEAKFPHCEISQGWGLTESSVAIGYNGAETGPKSCVGRLLPTWEARLVKDGKDVAPGEEGEIWARSPALMEGYHDNPKATADCMDGDWFKTGDVGRIDEDGFIYIVDRVKELIKYKGYQVAPAELEALLLQCPGVKDAGVVGVYSEAQATELPRAYVVADASPDFIAEWVKERVSNPKRLRGGVVLVNSIPKSPSGKILRKDLRTRAAQEMKAKL
ncbi:AMP binding protein [Trichosporon asahii var. asahii CBS 8904]|uniref:AMP binding protein n=1 Tax=Trichosporon asahii var. asahii (strain CBS 8904) TaxID=1220162 RepID=K1VN21_TRIAC|nr:AMP binding protein [Trichosporon asahii var. asahii CBS 8904]